MNAFRRVGHLALPLSLLAVTVLPAPAALGAALTVSINDRVVTEPDAGAQANAIFKITLNEPRATDVLVDFHTVNGSATAGPDYVAKSGTATIAAGQIQKFITIKVEGDDADELNETYFVELDDTSLGTISDASGKGSIVDNDGPGITITNGLQSEPPPDTPMVLGIQLDAASPQAVKVDFSTANGTATGRADYRRVTDQTVTFAPGETSKNVKVDVRSDLLDEPNETLFVNLFGAVNGTIVDGQGQGIILDNDCTGSDPGRGTAPMLGDVRGDRGSDVLTKTSNIVCGGEVDWWQFELRETYGTPQKAITARVTLTMDDTPAQGSGNLDLCVYLIGELIDCSESASTQNEIVELKADDNLNYQQHYFIYVAVKGSGLNINNYAVRIDGHVSVSGSANL